MTVRAKFKVTTVSEFEGGLKQVTLVPVSSGSKENEQFFKWTPSGEIRMGTINPAASSQFKPGTQFYVDFTSVEEMENETQ